MEKPAATSVGRMRARSRKGDEIVHRKPGVSTQAEPPFHAEPIAFFFDPATSVATMRKGMPSELIGAVASNLGISQDKLFDSLRLAKSTLKNRISKKAVLAPLEQDRLYRVMKVLHRAAAVLSDDDAAVAWINRKNRSLGGEAPLTLLDTEAGYDLVLDTLGQIEYGVY